MLSISNSNSTSENCFNSLVVSCQNQQNHEHLRIVTVPRAMPSSNDQMEIDDPGPEQYNVPDPQRGKHTNLGACYSSAVLF